jgi:hypothetical protein
VNTGRRYLLQQTVVFFPGEQGPFTASAQAEKPGYGYNNPMPGSLSYVEQPGTMRSNVLATITVATAPVPPASPSPAQAVILVGDDQPDMFTPDQIGQYVGFTAGANAGASGRILSFIAPTATAGSAVILEQLVTLALTATPSPAFQAMGGVATLSSGGTTLATGLILAARLGPGGHYYVAIALQTGSAASLAPGCTLMQPLPPSGTATGTVGIVLTKGAYSAEAPSGVPLSGGAGWEILDWVQGWGLSASNATSPAGGVIGMLDTLGSEKNLPRLPGETDGAYAKRQSAIADVVTPNAIVRALVRDVGASGWCFMEVGQSLFPGFFYDRPSDDENGDAYDYGSLLFSGAYTSGQFEVGEECLYVRGIVTLATGYWGALQTAATASNPSGYAPASYNAPQTPAPSTGAGFTLVLSRQRFAYPTPEIEWQTGDLIIGQRSGAVFTPSATIPNPSADAFRWHCLLDYEQFRGFFIAAAPNEDIQDFGFGWDLGGTCAWDASHQWLNYWDGYGTGDAAYYLTIFNDVERTRAGGVGWELQQTNGAPCT